MENDSNANNVLRILNLDMQIEKNIVSNVSFRDPKIEKIYNQLKIKKSFIDGDHLLILGWITTFLYVYFVYYRPIIFMTCLIHITLFVLLLYLKKKFQNHTNKINFLQILSFSIFLHFKCVHLNLYLENDDEQELQKEILRLIIFDFISFNLYDFTLLEESFFPRIVFCSINILSVIISKLHRSHNHFHMDGVTSIVYTVIFYMMKKSWEYNLRLIFCKTYCLDKTSSYTIDFINELKGIHLTKTKNLISVSGREVKTFSEFFKLDDENYKNESNEENEFLLKSDTSNTFNLFLNSMIEYNSETYKNNTNPILLKLPLIDENNLKDVSKRFTPLGIFYNNMNKDKFYEVFYRKFYLTENTAIDDLFFYNVSDAILSKNIKEDADKIKADAEKIKEDVIMKQRLYAKISHEFKTPLNSIIGLIQDIKDVIGVIDNLEISEKLETVENLSRYLILLTQDIIQFCSFSNINTISVKKIVIDIKEIIKFSNDILLCLLRCTSNKLNTIKPILIYDEKVNELIVKNDELRLKQILLNFVSNAVKFTKSGSITIMAKPDFEMKNVILSVNDTGIGISKENIDKLFQDFSMINNNSVDNSQGSGLGLSICKSLALKMGLKIKMNSQPLVGSTFSIIIPSMKKRGSRVTSSRSLSQYINREQNDWNEGNEKDISNNLNQNEEILKRKRSNNTISSNKLKNEVENERLKSNFNVIEENVEVELENSLIKRVENKKEMEAAIDDHNENDESDNNSIDTLLYDHNISRRYDLDEVFFKKGIIITIDDNKFVNQSIKKNIESLIMGTNRIYEVVCGSDGIDLLNFIRIDNQNENLIKCVIIDEEMEYLNGSKTIKIVRELQNNGIIKPITIFSSTCHEDITTQQLILDSGAQLILPKPLTKTDLKEAFKQFNIL